MLSSPPSSASRAGPSRATTTTSRRSSTTSPSRPARGRWARGSCSAGCGRRVCGRRSRTSPQQAELDGEVGASPRRPLLGDRRQPVERGQGQQLLQDRRPPGGEDLVGEGPVLGADGGGVGGGGRPRTGQG